MNPHALGGHLGGRFELRVCDLGTAVHVSSSVCVIRLNRFILSSKISKIIKIVVCCEFCGRVTLTLSTHHRTLAWWPFVAQGEIFKRKPMEICRDTRVTKCWPFCKECALQRILDVDDLVFNLNTLEEFRSNDQLEIWVWEAHWSR